MDCLRDLLKMRSANLGSFAKASKFRVDLTFGIARARRNLKKLILRFASNLEEMKIIKEEILSADQMS